MADIDKVTKGLECCILRNPDDKHRCSECPYEGNCVNRLKIDALSILKEQQAPVKPIKVVQSKELLVGTCPVCGKGHINNEDNNFCGKCGRKLFWTYIVDPVTGRKDKVNEQDHGSSEEKGIAVE